MSERLLPTSLHYLDHVAKCGSIQAAAKQLNISASAIDRQILLLEGHLGVSLFERMPRGMRPTAAGELIITLARRWRREVRRIGADIRYLEGQNQGHLRLVAMDSLANGVLPDIAGRLHRDHPGVTLEIDIVPTDAALTAIVNGEADIGLVFNVYPHRELRVLWSAELPLGCVVAPTHDLAGMSSVSLQQATQYPIALQNRALMIRRYLEARHDWLFQKGHPPVTTNSLQLVKMLAVSGDFIMLTSELDAAPELASGALIFVPIRDKAAEAQTISVVVSARSPLSKLGQMVAGVTAEEAAASLASARNVRPVPTGSDEAEAGE
ncbi:MAG: LysR family transcriptional regulator [Sphingobium sp.]